MTRYFLLMAIIFSLLGCSTVKIENDFMVHEDLYRVPIIRNDAWLRTIPSEPFDALYLRCPNNQIVIIFNDIFCNKFDYAKMTDEDYAKRLYTNEYFSFLEGFACPSRYSPSTDKNFNKLVSPVSVNKEKKQFTIEFETSFDQQMCGLSKGKTTMRVMDIFMEDPKERFINGVVNGPHTRFVVFRYASPEEKYEIGLTDFKEIVSKFQWLDK